MHEEVLFKYTCRPSCKDLIAVKNSYPVEKPLAPASEERNSIVDVISGVLKTSKDEAVVCESVNFY